MDRINLVFKPGDKVGLVGRNGAGKSTILKVLSGEINPDDGKVTTPSEATLGFLHQEIEIEQHTTVLQEALTAFEELKKIEKLLADVNVQISERTDYESAEYTLLLEKFSELNERYYLLGGETSEASAVKVLKGLGFKETDFDRKILEFSGGWQMRIVLAKMLLQRPDYLLLDEPTNHLDIESIIWLEGFLKDYQGCVILISHDQKFLDNCTKRTVEIELGRIEDYKAAYTRYLELRADRKEKQMAAFENQQRVIAQKERTITRFMAKASKTKMAQSMKKQLDKMERIEILDEDLATMNIRFPQAPRSAQVVVKADNVSKNYGALRVLEKIDLQIERGDRIAFVGQNGQGKTTLAKIIAGKLALTQGDLTIGPNVSLGYYAQDQAETLNRKKTLLETMEDHSPPEMRTKLRTMLGAFMFSGEDVDKKVSVLSGGERARLALACMLLNPINLLILDEPTNHLDMLSKSVLKQALETYDGTLIVVSHDRQFLEGLTNHTFEFRDRKIKPYLGDVEYFLEKRKLDNMRDVEKSRAKSTSQKSNNQNKMTGGSEQSAIRLSDEDRKKIRSLEKSIQKLEKKIEKIEAEIASLEEKMAETGFYGSDRESDIINQHHSKKLQLDEVMMEWETQLQEHDQISSNS